MTTFATLKPIGSGARTSLDYLFHPQHVLEISMPKVVTSGYGDQRWERQQDQLQNDVERPTQQELLNPG